MVVVREIAKTLFYKYQGIYTIIIYFPPIPSKYKMFNENLI